MPSGNRCATRPRTSNDRAFARTLQLWVYYGAVPDERIATARTRKAARLSTADRVASIITAAEDAADQIRDEAEQRLHERIAEAERAANNRVTAAEEEATEILEQARTTATSEALSVVGKASEEADAMMSEATAFAQRTRSEAEHYTRELLGEARTTAEAVRDEGLELVTNLRQMGDSLRANAERLLRDVQSVHSQMVARIERAEGNGRISQLPARSDPGRPTGRRYYDDDDVQADLPDVPEFIPRR